MNLEHVLPKKLNGQWSSFDEETHGSYVNRLGNMCLLLESENAKLGGVAFKEKAKSLKRSTVWLTKAIGNTSEWTATEIDARAAQLAKYAVKAWPLSTDLPKPAVVRQTRK